MRNKEKCIRCKTLYDDSTAIFQEIKRLGYVCLLCVGSEEIKEPVVIDKPATYEMALKYLTSKGA